MVIPRRLIKAAPELHLWIFFAGITALTLFFPTCAAKNKTMESEKGSNDATASLVARAGLIVSFSIESISANFAIDDMPYGYNPWMMRGNVIKVYKGLSGTPEGSAFETQVSIYMGAVRSRPEGLWVDEIPEKGEQWVLFGDSAALGKPVEKLLAGRGENVLAVYRLTEVKNGLRHLNRGK
jgi:hypothetical protein